jgi:hypothetical protein
MRKSSPKYSVQQSDHKQHGDTENTEYFEKSDLMFFDSPNKNYESTRPTCCKQSGK